MLCGPFSVLSERCVIWQWARPWSKYNEGMSEDKVRATILFIGEAHRTPKIGEPVRLHVTDGSWCEGFRCISAPFIDGGRRSIWVATEQEYAMAAKEGRAPAGDTWPVSQMTPKTFAV